MPTDDLAPDVVPDALLAVDSGGRILAVNTAAATMFGTGREDLVGHPVETVINGRSVDLDVVLHPIDIDSRPMTIAVVRDTTRDAEMLQERADARDEVTQQLFGLGMSLRSIAQTVDATEPARRIAAVVEGMSEIVDALGNEISDRTVPLPDQAS